MVSSDTESFLAHDQKILLDDNSVETRATSSMLARDAAAAPLALPPRGALDTSLHDNDTHVRFALAACDRALLPHVTLSIYSLFSHSSFVDNVDSDRNAPLKAH